MRSASRRAEPKSANSNCARAPSALRSSRTSYAPSESRPIERSRSSKKLCRVAMRNRQSFFRRSSAARRSRGA